MTLPEIMRRVGALVIDALSILWRLLFGDPRPVTVAVPHYVTSPEAWASENRHVGAYLDPDRGLN